jgi:hypothetical protein
MRTPMQELIDEAIKYSRELSTNGHLSESLAIDNIIDLAESFLQIEKEVIIDAHYWGGHHQPLKSGREYYKETFNNEER